MSERDEIKAELIHSFESLYNVPKGIRRELDNYIALLKKEKPAKLTDLRICKIISCVFLGIPELWKTGNPKGIKANKKLLTDFSTHLEIENKHKNNPRYKK